MIFVFIIIVFGLCYIVPTLINKIGDSNSFVADNDFPISITIVLICLIFISLILIK